MVNRYIDEGIAELVPGVLFVDEVSFYFIENPLLSHVRKNLVGKALIFLVAKDIIIVEHCHIC